MDQETTLGKFKEAFKEEKDTGDQWVLSMIFFCIVHVLDSSIINKI